MSRNDIVITSAARTAVGSFSGAFADVPAHVLGAEAIKAALARSNVAPGDVDEVIMGQILTAGQGQNPARQAAIGAGIPQEATAFGLNQLCGREVDVDPRHPRDRLVTLDEPIYLCLLHGNLPLCPCARMHAETVDCPCFTQVEL